MINDKNSYPNCVHTMKTHSTKLTDSTIKYNSLITYPWAKHMSMLSWCLFLTEKLTFHQQKSHFSISEYEQFFLLNFPQCDTHIVGACRHRRSTIGFKFFNSYWHRPYKLCLKDLGVKINMWKYRSSPTMI